MTRSESRYETVRKMRRAHSKKDYAQAIIDHFKIYATEDREKHVDMLIGMLESTTV